ncbi:hypothetical protein ACFL2G_03535 [Candidatus Omnitrophota bacterium]
MNRLGIADVEDYWLSVIMRSHATSFGPRELPKKIISIFNPNEPHGFSVLTKKHDSMSNTWRIEKNSYADIGILGKVEHFVVEEDGTITPLWMLGYNDTALERVKQEPWAGTVYSAFEISALDKKYVYTQTPLGPNEGKRELTWTFDFSSPKETAVLKEWDEGDKHYALYIKFDHYGKETMDIKRIKWQIEEDAYGRKLKNPEINVISQVGEYENMVFDNGVATKVIQHVSEYLKRDNVTHLTGKKKDKYIDGMVWTGYDSRNTSFNVSYDEYGRTDSAFRRDDSIPLTKIVIPEENKKEESKALLRGKSKLLNMPHVDRYLDVETVDHEYGSYNGIRVLYTEGPEPLPLVDISLKKHNGKDAEDITCYFHSELTPDFHKIDIPSSGSTTHRGDIPEEDISGHEFIYFYMVEPKLEKGKIIYEVRIEDDDGKELFIGGNDLKEDDKEKDKKSLFWKPYYANMDYYVAGENDPWYVRFGAWFVSLIGFGKDEIAYRVIKPAVYVDDLKDNFAKFISIKMLKQKLEDAGMDIKDVKNISIHSKVESGSSPASLYVSDIYLLGTGDINELGKSKPEDKKEEIALNIARRFTEPSFKAKASIRSGMFSLAQIRGRENGLMPNKELAFFYESDRGLTWIEVEVDGHTVRKAYKLDGTLFSDIYEYEYVEKETQAKKIALVRLYYDEDGETPLFMVSFYSGLNPTLYIVEDNGDNLIVHYIDPVELYGMTKKFQKNELISDKPIWIKRGGKSLEPITPQLKTSWSDSLKTTFKNKAYNDLNNILPKKIFGEIIEGTDSNVKFEAKKIHKIVKALSTAHPELEHRVIEIDDFKDYMYATVIEDLSDIKGRATGLFKNFFESLPDPKGSDRNVPEKNLVVSHLDAEDLDETAYIFDLSMLTVLHAALDDKDECYDLLNLFKSLPKDPNTGLPWRACNVNNISVVEDYDRRAGDYAWWTHNLLSAYVLTGDDTFLNEAFYITDRVIEHFQDEYGAYTVIPYESDYVGPEGYSVEENIDMMVVFDDFELLGVSKYKIDNDKLKEFLSKHAIDKEHDLIYRGIVKQKLGAEKILFRMATEQDVEVLFRHDLNWASDSPFWMLSSRPGIELLKQNGIDPDIVFKKAMAYFATSVKGNVVEKDKDEKIKIIRKDLKLSGSDFNIDIGREVGDVLFHEQTGYLKQAAQNLMEYHQKKEKTGSFVVIQDRFASKYYRDVMETYLTGMKLAYDVFQKDGVVPYAIAVGQDGNYATEYIPVGHADNWLSPGGDDYKGSRIVTIEMILSHIGYISNQLGGGESFLKARGIELKNIKISEEIENYEEDPLSLLEKAKQQAEKTRFIKAALFTVIFGLILASMYTVIAYFVRKKKGVKKGPDKKRVHIDPGADAKREEIEEIYKEFFSDDIAHTLATEHLKQGSDGDLEYPSATQVWAQALYDEIITPAEIRKSIKDKLEEWPFISNDVDVSRDVLLHECALYAYEGEIDNILEIFGTKKWLIDRFGEDEGNIRYHMLKNNQIYGLQISQNRFHDEVGVVPKGDLPQIVCKALAMFMSSRTGTVDHERDIVIEHPFMEHLTDKLLKHLNLDNSDKEVDSISSGSTLSILDQIDSEIHEWQTHNTKMSFLTNYAITNQTYADFFGMFGKKRMEGIERAIDSAHVSVQDFKAINDINVQEFLDEMVLKGYMEKEDSSVERPYYFTEEYRGITIELKEDFSGYSENDLKKLESVWVVKNGANSAQKSSGKIVEIYPEADPRYSGRVRNLLKDLFTKKTRVIAITPCATFNKYVEFVNNVKKCRHNASFINTLKGYRYLKRLKKAIGQSDRYTELDFEEYLDFSKYLIDDLYSVGTVWASQWVPLITALGVITVIASLVFFPPATIAMAIIRLAIPVAQFFLALLFHKGLRNDNLLKAIKGFYTFGSAETKKVRSAKRLYAWIVGTHLGWGALLINMLWPLFAATIGSGSIGLVLLGLGAGLFLMMNIILSMWTSMYAFEAAKARSISKKETYKTQEDTAKEVVQHSPYRTLHFDFLCPFFDETIGNTFEEYFLEELNGSNGLTQGDFLIQHFPGEFKRLCQELEIFENKNEKDLDDMTNKWIKINNPDKGCAKRRRQIIDAIGKNPDANKALQDWANAKSPTIGTTLKQMTGPRGTAKEWAIRYYGLDRTSEKQMQFAEKLAYKKINVLTPSNYYSFFAEVRSRFVTDLNVSQSIKDKLLKLDAIAFKEFYDTYIGKDRKKLKLDTILIESKYNKQTIASNVTMKDCDFTASDISELAKAKADKKNKVKWLKEGTKEEYTHLDFVSRAQTSCIDSAVTYIGTDTTKKMMMDSPSIPNLKSSAIAIVGSEFASGIMCIFDKGCRIERKYHWALMKVITDFEDSDLWYGVGERQISSKAFSDFGGMLAIGEENWAWYFLQSEDELINLGLYGWGGFMKTWASLFFSTQRRNLLSEDLIVAMMLRIAGGLSKLFKGMKLGKFREVMATIIFSAHPRWAGGSIQLLRTPFVQEYFTHGDIGWHEKTGRMNRLNFFTMLAFACFNALVFGVLIFGLNPLTALPFGAGFLILGLWITQAINMIMIVRATFELGFFEAIFVVFLLYPMLIVFYTGIMMPVYAWAALVSWWKGALGEFVCSALAHGRIPQPVMNFIDHYIGKNKKASQGLLTLFKPGIVIGAVALILIKAGFFFQNLSVSSYLSAIFAPAVAISMIIHTFLYNSPYGLSGSPWKKTLSIITGVLLGYGTVELLYLSFYIPPFIVVSIAVVIMLAVWLLAPSSEAFKDREFHKNKKNLILRLLSRIKWDLFRGRKIEIKDGNAVFEDGDVKIIREGIKFNPEWTRYLSNVARTFAATVFIALQFSFIEMNVKDIIPLSIKESSVVLLVSQYILPNIGFIMAFFGLAIILKRLYAVLFNGGKLSNLTTFPVPAHLIFPYVLSLFLPISPLWQIVIAIAVWRIQRYIQNKVTGKKIDNLAGEVKALGRELGIATSVGYAGRDKEELLFDKNSELKMLMAQLDAVMDELYTQSEEGMLKPYRFIRENYDEARELIDLIRSKISGKEILNLFDEIKPREKPGEEELPEDFRKAVKQEMKDIKREINKTKKALNSLDSLSEDLAKKHKAAISETNKEEKAFTKLNRKVSAKLKILTALQEHHEELLESQEGQVLDKESIIETTREEIENLNNALPIEEAKLPDLIEDVEAKELSLEESQQLLNEKQIAINQAEARITKLEEEIKQAEAKEKQEKETLDKKEANLNKALASKKNPQTKAKEIKKAQYEYNTQKEIYNETIASNQNLDRLRQELQNEKDKLLELKEAVKEVNSDIRTKTLALAQPKSTLRSQQQKVDRLKDNIVNTTILLSERHNSLIELRTRIENTQIAIHNTQEDINREEESLNTQRRIISISRTKQRLIGKLRFELDAKQREVEQKLEGKVTLDDLINIDNDIDSLKENINSKLKEIDKSAIDMKKDLKDINDLAEEARKKHLQSIKDFYKHEKELKLLEEYIALWEDILKSNRLSLRRRMAAREKLRQSIKTLKREQNELIIKLTEEESKLAPLKREVTKKEKPLEDAKEALKAAEDKLAQEKDNLNKLTAEQKGEEYLLKVEKEILNTENTELTKLKKDYETKEAFKNDAYERLEQDKKAYAAQEKLVTSKKNSKAKDLKQAQTKLNELNSQLTKQEATYKHADEVLEKAKSAFEAQKKIVDEAAARVKSLTDKITKLDEAIKEKNETTIIGIKNEIQQAQDKVSGISVELRDAQNSFNAQQNKVNNIKRALTLNIANLAEAYRNLKRQIESIKVKINYMKQIKKDLKEKKLQLRLKKRKTILTEKKTELIDGTRGKIDKQGTKLENELSVNKALRTSMLRPVVGLSMLPCIDALSRQRIYTGSAGKFWIPVFTGMTDLNLKQDIRSMLEHVEPRGDWGFGDPAAETSITVDSKGNVLRRRVQIHKKLFDKLLEKGYEDVATAILKQEFVNFNRDVNYKALRDLKLAYERAYKENLHSEDTRKLAVSLAELQVFYEMPGHEAAYSYLRNKGINYNQIRKQGEKELRAGEDLLGSTLIQLAEFMENYEKDKARAVVESLVEGRGYIADSIRIALNSNSLDFAGLNKAEVIEDVIEFEGAVAEYSAETELIFGQTRILPPVREPGEFLQLDLLLELEKQRNHVYSNI